MTTPTRSTTRTACPFHVCNQRLRRAESLEGHVWADFVERGRGLQRHGTCTSPLPEPQTKGE